MLIPEFINIKDGGDTVVTPREMQMSKARLIIEPHRTDDSKDDESSWCWKVTEMIGDSVTYTKLIAY
jgi:hypothetical protein